MICWKCGHPNEETSLFCEECGADIWHADPAPNRQQQNPNLQNVNQQGPNSQNVNQQGQNLQNVNQQRPNSQNVNQQSQNSQNVNHSGNRQTQADYRINQTQIQSESSRSQSVATEPKDNSLIKIAALIFAVLYIIKTIMYIPAFFSVLGGIFAGRHLFTSIISLLFSILWILSFVLVAGSLVLLALRRTKENEEYLYLSVVLAETLHIAVAVLRLFWNVIVITAVYRGKMTGSLFLSVLLIVLFALLVLALLFVLFSRDGQKPLLGKTKEELIQMAKDLPEVLRTEFETLSRQSSKSKGNGSSVGQTSPSGGSSVGQTSSGGGSYGGPSPVQPNLAGGPLKTNRGLLLYILLTFLTCGIYSWYFYYSIAKDANIICQGDGEETAGLLKHVLLTLITCGIYEYVWQCQFADRLRRNASRYGVTIEENGTTVVLWFMPGSFCCGIGPFVAYHIQIKNLNKMARAYNAKMFTQNRSNI